MNRIEALNDFTRLVQRWILEAKSEQPDQRYLPVLKRKIWESIDHVCAEDVDRCDRLFERIQVGNIAEAEQLYLAIFDSQFADATPDGTQGQSANDRMAAAVDDDPRRRAWKSSQWADLLGIRPDTVRNLPMWKTLRAMDKS